MKILMVCLGNICRSPLAEGIMRKKIEENGLDWEVDSAGTSAWHIGQAPDARSILVAQKYNIDISQQTARQIQTSDFENFDLLYAMDYSNYENIIKLALSSKLDFATFRKRLPKKKEILTISTLELLNLVRMLILPSGFQRTISVFSKTFRKDVWPKAQLLLMAAIICPGSRTVCNLLRSVGLQEERWFSKYHRLLNRDKWSAKRLAEVLLQLLVNAFVKVGEV
jgi:protein-tyrosine phosphatase